MDLFGYMRFTLCLFRNPKQQKHLFRWLNSQRKDYLCQRKIPWLVFDSIDFLNSLPLENKQVFEYGSGGSTLYWISRKMKCVSIEHDPIWYESLRNNLNTSGGIDYRLVQPEIINPPISLDITNPSLYISDDPTYRGYSFKKYVSQIDTFPHEYFDIVLIDGRARPSCIMHSATKVKVGGFLILDNSDRYYYLDRTSTLLQHFDKRTFNGVTPGATWFTETSVFMRKR